jgi:F0F1-type ATP synthase gamma subunit
MYRIVLLAYFVVFVVFASARGLNGEYYVTGIAYFEKKTVLKNTELIVIIGKDTTKILTNEKGVFDFTVKWVSACPSTKTKKQIKDFNKELNPKYIIIFYNDKVVKLRNKRESYSHLKRIFKRSKYVSKNLYFT